MANCIAVPRAALGNLGQAFVNNASMAVVQGSRHDDAHGLPRCHVTRAMLVLPEGRGIPGCHSIHAVLP